LLVEGPYPQPGETWPEGLNDDEKHFITYGTTKAMSGIKLSLETPAELPIFWREMPQHRVSQGQKPLPQQDFIIVGNIVGILADTWIGKHEIVERYFRRGGHALGADAMIEARSENVYPVLFPFYPAHRYEALAVKWKGEVPSPIGRCSDDRPTAANADTSSR
jgi:hypothetical protein